MTSTRSEVLPELPTVNEFVPGYEASQWYGIAAPKNTPQGGLIRTRPDIPQRPFGESRFVRGTNTQGE
jgi:Tripartite tricarboxylate transporter family receptor